MLHFWFRKHERRFDGELILLYAVWYGIGRALIEGLRTDSLYITGTGIRVSQLLAGVSAAAAAVVLALLYTGSSGIRRATSTARAARRGRMPDLLNILSIHIRVSIRMKDYRGPDLADKVVDAAGKAVSDEMRDKVAGATGRGRALNPPRA